MKLLENLSKTLASHERQCFFVVYFFPSAAPAGLCLQMPLQWQCGPLALTPRSLSKGGHMDTDTIGIVI